MSIHLLTGQRPGAARFRLLRSGRSAAEAATNRPAGPLSRCFPSVGRPAPGREADEKAMK
jgi:hypothetical protein